MQVNLEADVLARYVQRALSGREDDSGSATGASGGLTETLLREQGFV